MKFSFSYEFWPLDFLLCELPVYVFGPFVYQVGVLDIFHLPLQISQLPHCALGPYRLAHIEQQGALGSSDFSQWGALEGGSREKLGYLVPQFFLCRVTRG